MSTTEPFRLFNWTAKRSGAAITIDGYSQHGNPTKLGSVVSITTIAELVEDLHGDAGEAVIAIDAGGKHYWLMTETLAAWQQRTGYAGEIAA